MNSLNLRLPSRRTGYVAATFMLLFATITSTFASAAQITSRSVELSSSAKDASGVVYSIDFTAVSAAGAVVVDFCSDSPLLGATCTAPTGFDASSATLTGGLTKDATNTTASKFIATGSISAGAVNLTLTGVHNPTNTGPLYARIVTFTDDTGSTAYTSTAPGTHIDDGSVAASITDTIGVSAAVLESLTFCVGGANAGANPFGAGCSGTIPAPTLTLGETVGSVKALSSSAVSTGDIYTQLSTNAASGAIVRLKSFNNCGGLMRVGSAVCDITPQGTTSTISAGQPKFGVKVAADAATDTSLSATGTFQTATGSSYDGTNYRMNWVSGNASGVSSTYGDPILDTGAPGSETQPSNRNMKLTFAASIAPNTPAGLYTNNLSLIATGKF